LGYRAGGVRRSICARGRSFRGECSQQEQPWEQLSPPRSKRELERALHSDAATWQHLPASQPSPQTRDGDSCCPEPPVPGFL
jgi:hypothetical protein